MISQGAESIAERRLVERCLAGESAALSIFRDQVLVAVGNALITRGADAAQVQEVLNLLWADCVVNDEKRSPLLERFTGKSSLRTWLFRIALNRLLDLGRSVRRLNYLAAVPDTSSKEEMTLADMPVEVRESQPDLVTLLRDSLAAAFAATPAEDLLKVRLVFLHGITQRELARLWDRHEATVSRDLRRIVQSIADRTLREAKKRDPQLTLTWEDFVGLCDADPLDFV